MNGRKTEARAPAPERREQALVSRPAPSSRPETGRARRALALALRFLALGSSGCASYGLHLTATPLAPGARELSLNADALVIDRGLGPQVLPNPELGYRVGVASDLDVGARLNAGSLEANARWRLTRGALDLAVVPGLGFGFVPVTNNDTGIFNAHALASVLAGLQVSPRTSIVLGPRAVVTYAFPLTAFSGDATGDKVIHALGGVLGARFQLGASSYLSPEINALVPYDTAREEWYFPTLQAGLALQW